jgi:hypothetical protein
MLHHRPYVRLRSNSKTSCSVFGIVSFTPSYYQAHCDTATFNHYWTRLVTTLFREPSRLTIAACVQCEWAKCCFGPRGATAASCRKGDPATTSSRGNFRRRRFEERWIGEACVG